MRSNYDWRKLRAPLELICSRLCKCFLLYSQDVMLPPKQAITQMYERSNIRGRRTNHTIKLLTSLVLEVGVPKTPERHDE